MNKKLILGSLVMALFIVQLVLAVPTNREQMFNKDYLTFDDYNKIRTNRFEWEVKYDVNNRIVADTKMLSERNPDYKSSHIIGKYTGILPQEAKTGYGIKKIQPKYKGWVNPFAKRFTTLN